MNEFNNNENKAFLWDILNKKGVFNGLAPESIHPQFEKLFNETIKAHYGTNNVNTITLNKEFLSKFVKSTHKQVNERTRNGNTETLEKIYDTNQIRKDIADDFNRNLSNKKNEFEDTITLKRPSEVDFTDKNDEQPIDSSRIDELLKQQLEKRNLDIPKVNESSYEFKKASNWITNSQDNTEDLTVKGGTQSKTVSFNDDMGLQNYSESQPKVNSISPKVNSISPKVNSISNKNINQVRDHDTGANTTSSQTLKSSLKNGLVGNDGLHKKLDEILENQKYIINNIHELLDRR